jgi:DNA repair protein RecN (Recombination protein N)
MLQYLRIRNLALLEEVSLEFGPGFTAVTGETGAGKSVLIGALALLSGARVDKTILRTGSDACEVECQLVLDEPGEVNALLEGAGLPICEDGSLVLRRIVPRDKPQRILINGSLATLATLQAVGECWIDFHGPSEPRKLLRPEYQLDLLDAFGGTAALVREFKAAYGAWRAVLARIREVESTTRMSDEQIEFVQGQIDMIDRLKLSEEAILDLERDFQRSQRSQELLQACSQIVGGLQGDKGIAGRLAPLVRAARQLAEIDPGTGSLVQRLVALSVEVSDLARDFEALAGDFDFNPAATEKLEARMNAWMECQRRHGPTVAQVLAAREEMAARLALQTDIEGTLSKLRSEASAALAEAAAVGKKLHEHRIKAGKALERELEPVIAGLGFKRASFEVAWEPEPELTAHGSHRAEFLFSPNPGEPVRPIAKIASSGELARVMLALKALLAEADNTPLLVFDEVDANVGGEIGRVVGERLAEVARRHQVLCVTHLPQVAALGRQHLLVEKTAHANHTTVSIRVLGPGSDERIGELARMLGDRGSDSARTHARELLRAGRI